MDGGWSAIFMIPICICWIFWVLSEFGCSKGVLVNKSVGQVRRLSVGC